MSKARNPPTFIAGECFVDNLLPFGGEETPVVERLQAWVKQSLISECPIVVSPLHTPDTGKPHLHFIIDVSNFDYRDIKWFEGLFKSVDLPRPETVRNIYNAEKYLTHDTLQAQREEKQRFTPDECDTMVYLNGYTMHELTDRSSRDEVSKIVYYIAMGLRKHIKEGGHVDTFTLTELVCDPEFYVNLDTSLPADIVIGKGFHEIKINYRYYVQYANDFKTSKDLEATKSLEKEAAEARKEIRKDNKEFCSYLLGLLSCIPDNAVQRLFYECYGNDIVFRGKVKEIGFSNLNYRLYIDNYVQYCAITNGCSDRFIKIASALEKWYEATNDYKFYEKR